MKRKFLFFLLISIILNYSCSYSKRPAESKGGGFHTFNMDKIKIYPSELSFYSSLFKKVSIIPLETNEDCLIGYISKIKIVDQHIFVLDSHKARCLFVFNKEGKFIRKIGKTGNGPGEYNTPTDFTIDRDNQIVYVLDNDLQRINKYDLATGRFINAITLEKGVRSHQIELFKGILYADASFNNHSDDNYLFRSIEESSGKEESHFLNVIEYNKGFSANIIYNTFYMRENGNIIFVQLFMDHIIEISKDSVFSLIELNGSDFFTSEDIKQIMGGGVTQYSEGIRMLNKYHSIHSFIEKGDIILFDMKQGRFLHKLLFDKKTNELFVIKNLRDDLLLKDNISAIMPTIGCYDQDGVYCYLEDSYLTSKYRTLAKAGGLSPETDRLEDLKNLAEEANPIIIYYEFKE